jgi:hypothetical protein
LSIKIFFVFNVFSWSFFMNQSYRLVWSAVRGAWTAVSELAKSHAKSGTVIAVVAAATVAAPVQAVTGGVPKLAPGEQLAQGTVTGDLIQTASGAHAIDALNVPIFDALTGMPIAPVRFSGTNFNISSIDVAAIRASGVNAKIVELNTGATYNISTGNGVSGLLDSPVILTQSGGSLDLTSAKLINVTSNFYSVLYARDVSRMDLSNVVINQTSLAPNGRAIAVENGSYIGIKHLDLTTNVKGIDAFSGSSQGVAAVLDIGAVDKQSLIKATGTAVDSYGYAKVNLLNTAISTTGNGAKGVNVYQGGEVTMTDNSSISTTGANAVGLSVDGTGSYTDPTVGITSLISTANLNKTSITTTGEKAEGISIRNYGQVNLTDSSVTTEGDESHGIFAVGGNVSVLNSNIITTGAGSAGVKLWPSGNATLTGANIRTEGDYSPGVQASIGSWILTITGNTQIETFGKSSEGVSLSGVQIGTKTTLNGVSVITNGADSIGINLGESRNVTFVGTTNILTKGDNSMGLFVEQGSVVSGTLTGKIGTTGDNSVGIQSGADNLAVGDVTVITEGVGSTGIDVTAGQVSLSGTNNVSTTGNGAVGVKVEFGSEINFAGTNNITTKGSNSTGLLIATGATATGTLTGKIETTGANAAGIE